MNVPQELKQAVGLLNESSSLFVSQGLDLIATLTFNNPVMKALAGQYGCIELIQRAMEKHIQYGSIQEDGCRALRNILFKSSVNKQIFHQNEVVCVLIQGMKIHLDNPVLQSEYLWLLNVACMRHGPNIQQTRSYLDGIQKTLTRYPVNRDIQKKGMFLVAVLESK